MGLWVLPNADARRGWGEVGSHLIPRALTGAEDRRRDGRQRTVVGDTAEGKGEPLLPVTAAEAEGEREEEEEDEGECGCSCHRLSMATAALCAGRPCTVRDHAHTQSTLDVNAEGR